jgi:hypothetical protein
MIVDKKDLKIGHWYQVSISHKGAYYKYAGVKESRNHFNYDYSYNSIGDQIGLEGRVHLPQTREVVFFECKAPRFFYWKLFWRIMKGEIPLD